MENFKGTRGKWYRNTESRIVSSVYSENKESLIHISGKNNEEAKANALLISKAPEMLEMLNSVHGELLRNDGVLDVQKWGDKIEQLIKSATEL